MASENTELHQTLGAIQSDIRHILQSTQSLNSSISVLERRIVVVEKFNVRVTTYGSLVGLVLAALVSASVRTFF